MTNLLNYRTKQMARYACCLAGLLTLFFTQTARAETPADLAKRFAKFKFVFHEKVQDPEIFLQTRSGDCDDFATLVSDLLAKKGYKPRLFAVRMKGETHVVCYVPEVKAYLDYNNRAETNPLVATDGSLQDIATKVARSFDRDWLSAYEFTYSEKTKWLVDTVVMNQNRDRGLLATFY